MGGRTVELLAVAIQVEEVSHFLMAQRVAATIEGSPLSPFRRARVWRDGSGREVLAVERRGYRGTLPTEMPADYPGRYLHALERWATRPRRFDDTREGMEQTLKLARSLVGELGADTAAWVAFAAERIYWQQRNRAGQVQKSRQDSLGLGWANHDHHAFRSSREVFSVLIQILETFGFHRRERFYAGEEAGWGAQVMEQPVCRLAVFADVDLAPEEMASDFTRQPLPPREELGTVGLWCALHGESMLTAGLHHLAGRFDFDAATAGLDGWGVKMLHPFSEFLVPAAGLHPGRALAGGSGAAGAAGGGRPDQRQAAGAVCRAGGGGQPPGEHPARRGVQGVQPDGGERHHPPHRSARGVMEPLRPPRHQAASWKNSLGREKGQDWPSESRILRCVP